jgi:hypothetical protein
MPTPPAPAQVSGAPVKSGPSALKIILIIVAIIVGLGILGIGTLGFFTWRYMRTMHVDSQTGQMTMQTPGGKLNLNTSQNFTAAELGTDPYPGAQSTRGGMKMDLPSGSLVTGVFLTSDPISQVTDYYKSKLSGASVAEKPGSTVISLETGHQESVMVTITNSSRDDGKTKIVILHTTKK